MPKGEKVLSPKQKDRTAPPSKNFKIFEMKFSIGILLSFSIGSYKDKFSKIGIY
jgi:hypothetical protein